MALVAQMAGHQFVEWVVLGSIPLASRLSGCRSFLHPPGAGIDFRVGCGLEEKKERSYKRSFSSS